MTKIKRNLILLTLFLILLFASGFAWIFFTQAGAVAVLGAISRFSPMQIETAEVRGRLAGALRLEQVRVLWPQGEGEAQTLILRWRPLPLLRGALAIEELRLHAGTVQLREDSEAPAAAVRDFTFPEIDGLPLRLQGEIEKVQIDDLRVRNPAGEVLQVDHLQGSLAWNTGRLEIEHFEFTGSPGRLTGSGSAEFVSPALVLDLQLWPATAIDKIDSVALQVNLQPVAGERQLAGMLELDLRGAAEDRLHLQSAVDWRPDRIALGDLLLTRPGSAGELRGEAALSAAEGWPFDLSLHFVGIDLFMETGIHTALSGRVAAEGNQSGWKGQFNLDNRVAGWQKGEVTGLFTGTAKGIALTDLRGVWLQGNLQGKLSAGWETGWQIETSLTGTNLQPAAIVAEWPGRINFELQGSASGGEDVPIVASIQGNLRDSTLRGRALTGDILASMRGEDVRIERLELRGDGFALHAKGRLQEKIAFNLNIPRLGGLLPDAAGSLRASGWGYRREGALAGEMTAQGEQIVWRDLRIGRAKISAVRKAKAASFAVKADFRELVWRDYRLASASLQADGSVEQHRLQLTTTGAGLQLSLSARGGYAEEVWQGQLLSLKTGGRRAGNWTLREPTAVRLGEDQLQVSPFRLTGEGEAFVTAEADLRLSPLQGWLAAEWRQLDLSQANPWLTEMSLLGRSSGSGRIEWLPEERLDLRGELTATGSLTRAGERLQVRQLKARFAGNAEGQQGEITADLAEFGSFSLTAESPHPAAATWPQNGSFAARWQIADLTPLSPWLPQVALAGSSFGNLNGKWSEKAGVQIAGEAEMAGRLRHEALQLEIRRAQTKLAWGETGLRADWAFDLGDQGRLAGQVTSGVPAGTHIPKSGQLQMSWEKLDLALLRPWLPPDLLLTGGLSGKAQGEWLPEKRLRLTGEANVIAGKLQWQDEVGVVTAGVQQGRLRWNWQDEALAGDLQLKMENFGQAEGDFRIPLPARWPARVDIAGPVQGRLQAELQEEGLLNAFLPGLVQESQGKLNLDLRLTGDWQSPAFGGAVHLREAAAYLPTAGIRVEQVEIRGQLEGQELVVNSVQLRSGAGSIVGEGRVQLNQWRLDSYQLNLRGENFRAVNLPELQMQISPDLQISGTAEKLTVRGSLRIPELLITGQDKATLIRPSSDVVIVDAPQTTVREMPMIIDVRVRVTLGEHVLIETEGIDARLEGGALLTMSGLEPQAITAQGEIKVAQGKYSTYGVSLDITRGSLLFAGGPVHQPTLDILALRTVGEVKAGFKVSGTPANPRVELFSEPAMADTDILAYVVLGHPLGQEGGANAGLLMLAANALLSKGESAVMQDRLKRTFGLDVLEINAGDGDVQGSQITIGKYLHPDLYISFGQSLFSPANEVRMRYNLSRRWQIESSVGDESAVDLYYKIEFR